MMLIFIAAIAVCVLISLVALKLLFSGNTGSMLFGFGLAVALGFGFFSFVLPELLPRKMELDMRAIASGKTAFPKRLTGNLNISIKTLSGRQLTWNATLIDPKPADRRIFLMGRLKSVDDQLADLKVRLPALNIHVPTGTDLEVFQQVHRGKKPLIYASEFPDGEFVMTRHASGGIVSALALRY
jgi:hypothetical protein